MKFKKSNQLKGLLEYFSVPEQNTLRTKALRFQKYMLIVLIGINANNCYNDINYKFHQKEGVYAGYEY